MLCISVSIKIIWESHSSTVLSLFIRRRTSIFSRPELQRTWSRFRVVCSQNLIDLSLRNKQLASSMLISQECLAQSLGWSMSFLSWIIDSVGLQVSHCKTANFSYFPHIDNLLNRIDTIAKVPQRQIKAYAVYGG